MKGARILVTGVEDRLGRLVAERMAARADVETVIGVADAVTLAVTGVEVVTLGGEYDGIGDLVRAHDPGTEGRKVIAGFAEHELAADAHQVARREIVAVGVTEDVRQRLLLGHAGVAAEPRYQRPDWKGAAAAVGPPRSSRALVFNPPFSNPGPFRVYFDSGSPLRAAVTSAA